MVIYLDLIFILNSLADALALYVTGRLSGLPLKRTKLLTAALLGGVYGTLCIVPHLSFLCGFPFQILAASVLVRSAFGKQKTFLRLLLLFFILSCTLGGAMIAVSQYITANGIANILQNLNWKVFLLVSISCYIFLSFLFRGSMKHAVAGEIYHAVIGVGEQTVALDVLLDTGHTLSDPYTGDPVLTVWRQALTPIWSEREQAILMQLETQGSAWCAEKLSEVSSRKFRLIPYRAVGINSAMLLAIQADQVCLNGKNLGAATLTLSPTPVSDSGGYAALWGGERKGKTKYAA